MATLLLPCTALGARAQCPDGTPPPCRGAPAPILRRLNPALNARAWIVVPFANVTRAQDLEWLRDASVNLLTLDMGRWTDVSMVPDKRVGDLLRELPPKSAMSALTLSEGLAVARRAGAGRLVMGDFYKEGAGARLVATVFDVKTGDRVRTVSQQAAATDSLLTAFGPLARSVLAVPPPPDARTGDVGTQSLEAYQAYLLGVKALNRFDLLEARKQIARALVVDSSFALAHLQFANLLEWSDLAGGPLAKSHAYAAQRFGTKLPRRERMLIEAGVASSDANYGRLCDIARTLVAKDSTDIQAVFLLGECNFHDDAVVVSATDTMKAAYRGSWPTAIRSFTRVIELDPTYLGAFEHVIGMLERTHRATCVHPGEPGCWDALVLRSGDTLEATPIRTTDTAGLNRQFARLTAERPSLQNHRQEAEIAQRWVDLDPSSEGARMGRARAARRNGDLVGADEHLRRIPPRASEDNLDALRLKLEVAAKLGRGTEARAMFDSIVKVVPDRPSLDVERGSIDLLFGRLARFERGAAAAAASAGPEAVAYQRQIGPALLGFPRAGMLRDEAVFVASINPASCNDECRMDRVAATFVYAPHAPLGAWPALAAGHFSDPTFGVSGTLAAHDTSALRRSAQRLEAIARRRTADQLLDPRAFISALAYLALDDSASALRMTRFFVDSSMVFMGLTSDFITGLAPASGAPLWPRAMLLRADLAAAAGLKGEAAAWYDRVLDLWADADAGFQPAIQRIRKSRAALGR